MLRRVYKVYEQEFENQSPKLTVDSAKDFLTRKRRSVTHEMMLMAKTLKQWQDQKLAVFEENVITISDNISEAFKAHIKKKYKIFDELKDLRQRINKLLEGGLTGYAGDQQVDAGMFHCPYIPLQMVGVVDPATTTPVNLNTRYGVVG